MQATKNALPDFRKDVNIRYAVPPWFMIDSIMRSNAHIAGLPAALAVRPEIKLSAYTSR